MLLSAFSLARPSIAQSVTAGERRTSSRTPPARLRQLRPIMASQTSQPQADEFLTCKTCKQRFSRAENSPTACQFHPAIWTGGELGKYTGFVPDSPAYEDRMKVRGMAYFWDCCGATSKDAPGCKIAAHVSFDGQS